MSNSGNVCTSVEDIIERVKRYHANADTSLIERAYHFAEKAHEGQVRKSGEPYFTHPCAIAVILADFMLDSTTIAAGLLHDVVEDVEGITLETIENEFGQEVALLVDGVTKLKRLDFTSKEEQQAESIRKMLLAMAKDIRVVLIKLADRLHNMRTLKFQPRDRQIAIARETLDIYAPLAHRLGVYSIKWELEDLSFRYLNPEAFYDIVDKVGIKREEREKQIKVAMDLLRERLEEVGIHAEIDGRPKHLYSIYRKMQTQNKTFEQIQDLIAMRVIVETQQDCYYVLGIVHTMWPQIPGRFKDYISVPKNNMYQSLHTTVVGPNGTPFEVQIRTYEMHRTAEYGIAAHWRYKEGKAADELDEKLSWLRRILDWQSDTRDSDEFSKMLKFDLFADEVFVFTPRGDIISLPSGATPLDFAYRIHSAVGNKCVGAKVNGHIVPLSTPVQTGDFIEIMTSASSKGPSLDWLQIVKTSDAKTKIRAYLKKESREENLATGRDMLEREAKRLGYSLGQLTKAEYLESLYGRYSVQSLDDICVAIGFGGLSTVQVLNRLVEQYKKNVKPEVPEVHVPAEGEVRTDTRQQKTSSASHGVYVEGEDGMLVRFARCCNPLPGDDIVGYITRGRGVSVHRRDCINMNDSAIEPERFVNVSWEGANTDSYEADLQILAYDKSGILAEIINTFNTMEIPIIAVSARTMKNSTLSMSFTVSLKNKQQMEKVFKQLLKRSDIIEVYRTST